jgi:hypothetical protein
MTENIKKLILDHLRARHTDIVGLREGLREIKQRLTSLESAFIGLRRDMADQHARCDRLAERIGRIEKWLSSEENLSKQLRSSEPPKTHPGQ